MKTMIQPLCLFMLALLLPGHATRSQSPLLELPIEAREMLNAKFPGWQYAEISDEVREGERQYGHANARLDLISGDFNGDERADYAALINYGTARLENDEVVGPDIALVIFIARRQGYRLHTIKDPGGEYIALIRKGDKGYDFELQKEFIFEHDAIDAIIFEKGATSYVYEHGHFRAIITGD